MSSALCLWSGHRKSALDALELFTFRRTVNYSAELGLDGNFAHYVARGPANQTVEGPSQIRYVHYLEAVLYSGISPLSMNKMLCTNISLPVSSTQKIRPLYFSVMIRCLRYPVFDSCNSEEESVWVLEGEAGDSNTCQVNTIVWGDVRVEIFKHKTKLKTSPRKLFAFMVFNTAFYNGKTHITWKKPKIDVINKDKKHLIVDEDFYVTFQFDPHGDHELLRLEAKARQLFYDHGDCISLDTGEWMISEEDFATSSLYLVASGSVEGVVTEIAHVDGSVQHPLGRSASEACSLGKD